MFKLSTFFRSRSCPEPQVGGCVRALRFRTALRPRPDPPRRPPKSPAGQATPEPSSSCYQKISAISFQTVISFSLKSSITHLRTSSSRATMSSFSIHHGTVNYLRSTSSAGSRCHVRRRIFDVAHKSETQNIMTIHKAKLTKNYQDLTALSHSSPRYSFSSTLRRLPCALPR